MKTELETLKEQADELGISYSNNISVAKLQEKITEEVNKKYKATDTNSQHLARKKAYNKAMKLVRVIVTPNNPAKKELNGEIFTVSNDVCTAKKYVPYNNENGWHIPYIIYKALKEKKTQLFTNKKLPNGIDVREGRVVSAYNIIELPALTEKELEDLRKAQTARQSIES